MQKVVSSNLITRSTMKQAAKEVSFAALLFVPEPRLGELAPPSNAPARRPCGPLLRTPLVRS